MAAAPAPAAPRFLSKSINWGAGGVGVAGKEGAYNALLVSRRKGGEIAIEDLGTHSQPWFAAVCHDVLFLKAAFDDGNRSLEGLERAHIAARPGGERLLNFPLSSYTCQPPFWEALDDLSYGQLVVQLRCRRDLARVVFFGDTWDPMLPKKRRQQQKQQQQQQQQKKHQAEEAAHRGISATAPQHAAREQQPPAEGGAAAGRQQPRGQQQARSSDGAPGSPPSEAAADAGVRPALKKVQPEWSTSSEESAPVLASGASPAAAAAPGAAAARRAQRAAGPRPVVLSDSDSEGQAPGARQQEQPAAAPAAGAAPAARPRGAADAGDQGVPVAAPPAKKRKTAPTAAMPTRGTAAAAAAAAMAAAGAAAPGGPRPAEEPWNVWIKDNPEFPPGSGKFPFYIKKGPMSKNYYTISVAAGEALLDDGHDTKFEGDLTLQDATSGRTWDVHTNLKREANKGQQRYLTRTSHFNRDNDLQPHDVLWLQRGPRRDCLLFGVWRWGSQEAADFAAKLGGAKRGGGKKGGATPAVTLSPASATKKAAKELFEDD